MTGSLIWPQEVTLARWTQPSGPLCLWQCLWSLLDHLILPSWWPIKCLLGPWQSWITCWPRCDNPSHNRMMTTFGSPNDNLMSNWPLLYDHVVTTCFSFLYWLFFLFGGPVNSWKTHLSLYHSYFWCSNFNYDFHSVDKTVMEEEPLLTSEMADQVLAFL